jgi:hypothetical protein
MPLQPALLQELILPSPVVLVIKKRLVCVPGTWVLYRNAGSEVIFTHPT